jgi:DNA-binding NarL/FixJ family response regulator
MTMSVQLPPAVDLTERQKKVLALIACGKSAKEIATDMGVSVKTVEKHRAMIYERLNIHDAVTLTLFAVREKFVVVR